jgi:acyl-CoA synthetase (NDP forming)
MTGSMTRGSIAGFLEKALADNRGALSEAESREVLAACDIPMAPARLCGTVAEAAAAAQEFGWPVALKACGPDLMHKSDRGLVRLLLGNREEMENAFAEMAAALEPEEYDGFLVQPMINGKRELIIGGMRDPFFGPCVMAGVGGIAVEAMKDAAFRLAPLEKRDALEMMNELRAHAIFGAFRGDPESNRDVIAEIICAVGRLLVAYPAIESIDINPVILRGAEPVAVDALITLAHSGDTAAAPYGAETAELEEDKFHALFAPESVAIIGASESALKWGFRILFNTIEGGFKGRLYGINPKHDRLLGVPCLPDINAVPDNLDLVFVVVPPPAVPGALRQCAARGVKAVVIITAGFAELGDDASHAAQEEIAAIARKSGMLVAGPNCAGIASPAPRRLYCGMISRYPGAGGLSIVSQSGNVGSTVLTWAQLHQAGVARFVSSGNEAAVRTSDYLRFFARDDSTESILSYVESAKEGRVFFEALRETAQIKPVVVVKGGRSEYGRRAASSHTGALATGTRLFRCACRQAGATVVDEIYQAMEVSGIFLHQPLPKGRRVVIVSQGGGWGVMGADACAEAGLDLIDLPGGTMEHLDAMLPGWWSRNNPIDLVAASDIDLLSRTVETVIKAPEVDAVILLGAGYIASAFNRYQDSARASELGLDKLSELGAQAELQDARRIAALIAKYGKPLLIASDTILMAYGARPNQTIEALEQQGVYIFSSPARVAQALAHMAERYEFLQGMPRRGRRPGKEE